MIKTKNIELLRQQVYEDIKRDIISGIYQAGEQLSPKEIAEKYRISATPIREAFNALQQEGLVQILPRVGYFVSQFTIKDIQDLFEFRILIEGASAEIAAKNITEEELAYLSTIPVDFTEGDQESYWKYVQNNREFHFSIALASRNQMVAKTVGSLLDQMERLVYMCLDIREYGEEIMEHHPRVIAALRKRDGILAKEVMIEGIESTRKAVLEAVLSGANLPIQLRG